MNLFAKILGGTTGYLLGGPIGAIIGVGISDDLLALIPPSGSTIVVCPSCNKEGIIYEEGFHVCSKCGKQSYFFCFRNREEYFQFTHTLFLFLLYNFCVLNGGTTKNKMSVIMDFLTYDLGYDIHERQSALKIFNSAKFHHLRSEEIIQKYYYCFQDDSEALIGTVNLLIKIASVNDPIQSKDAEFISKVIKVFRIDPYYFSNSSLIHKFCLIEFYNILGCNITDGLDTITKKYRLLAQLKHPDKFMKYELSREKIIRINEEFLEIKNAFENLSKIFKKNNN